jgi:hypothetical protein
VKIWNETKIYHIIVDHRSEASTSTIGSGRHVKDVRVFTVLREKDEPSLGFCVRGGSEHGLGIYVSEIEDDSAAGTSCEHLSLFSILNLINVWRWVKLEMSKIFDVSVTILVWYIAVMLRMHTIGYKCVCS